MAIVSCTEIGPRETSRSTRGNDSATTTYRVITTGRQNGWEAVPGLPALGDAWPGNSGIFAQDVRAREAEQLEGGRWAWDVEITYAPAEFDMTAGGGDYPVNPLLRPAMWSFGGRMVQYFPTKDKWDRDLVNTAGDPLDPIEGFFRVHGIATIHKNLASFSMADVTYWVNGINSDAVQGIPRGHLLVTDMTADLRRENGFSYWAGSVTVEYNPEGWQPKLINQGMRYWKTSGEKETLCWAEDADGNKATEPVLLNESGGLLIDPTTKPSEMPDVVWLYPIQHEYVNFSHLLGV